MACRSRSVSATGRSVLEYPQVEYTKGRTCLVSTRRILKAHIIHHYQENHARDIQGINQGVRKRSYRQPEQGSKPHKLEASSSQEICEHCSAHFVSLRAVDAIFSNNAMTYLRKLNMRAKNKEHIG